MRDLRILVGACLGILCGAGSACQKTAQVETGAVLLTVAVAPGITAPDALLASVYDDTGTLWQGSRIPAEGSLPPAKGDDLGTVLIQPGPSQGALRIDLRGLLGGSPVLEGLLVIPPGDRGRGTFDLTLAGGLSPDGDGDGVPDQIDDCPTVPDASQTGCAHDAAVDRRDGAGGNGGGKGNGGNGGNGGSGRNGGNGGNGGSGGNGGNGGHGGGGAHGGGGGNGGGGGHGGGGGADAGSVDATGGCGLDGGCAKALGAPCGADVQCASSFCVDGVCCSTACLGTCRACNQPTGIGTCAAYAPGTDPEVECSGGKTCNGAGACGPVPASGSKTNGQLCGGALECSSGFCTDGVCCDNACAGVCQTCATGSCQMVKKNEDVPECVAPMTCNNKGKCVAP